MVSHLGRVGDMLELQGASDCRTCKGDCAKALPCAGARIGGFQMRAYLTGGGGIKATVVVTAFVPTIQRERKRLLISALPCSKHPSASWWGRLGWALLSRVPKVGF